MCSFLTDTTCKKILLNTAYWKITEKYTMSNTFLLPLRLFWWNIKQFNLWSPKNRLQSKKNNFPMADQNRSIFSKKAWKIILINFSKLDCLNNLSARRTWLNTFPTLSRIENGTFQAWLAHWNWKGDVWSIFKDATLPRRKMVDQRGKISHLKPTAFRTKIWLSTFHQLVNFFFDFLSHEYCGKIRFYGENPDV